MTIAGASILITGGTGSFGRAFTRHCLNAGASRVRILSRGEHAQAQMATEFLQHDTRLGFFIGDVRDRNRLYRAMQGVDIVIHAAALKRIEVGAYCPDEMVNTNVFGAMNVIEAATESHVERVVALSTDKAYQPVSPYGYSKALAECLFLSNFSRGPRFSVTRYGNVAGSAGSVIPRWREILKNGTTVPVTDPECSRFWMTMQEAVDLVAHTVTTSQGGELVIPDLPAYRLGDLVTAMGANPTIIGLPAWEKKHEGMRDGLTSDTAPRLSVDQLRAALKYI